MRQFYLAIRRIEDGAAVKVFEPFEDERRAEKCRAGVEINLDVERYYTEITTSRPALAPDAAPDESRTIRPESLAKREDLAP